MMNGFGKRCVQIACGLLLLVLVGCSKEPDGWMPVLEETSTTFLKREAETAARRLQAARNALESNPKKAATELAAADDSLQHLLTYYLPLLEARELAYNAYRHYHLGKAEQTVWELDKVESILMSVAHTGHGHLLREMEEPLEKLEDARAALRTDSAKASSALRELATRLNFLLVKGDLVLT